jgi:hypothetical protein
LIAIIFSLSFITTGGFGETGGEQKFVYHLPGGFELPGRLRDYVGRSKKV